MHRWGVFTCRQSESEERLLLRTSLLGLSLFALASPAESQSSPTSRTGSIAVAEVVDQNLGLDVSLDVAEVLKEALDSVAKAGSASRRARRAGPGSRGGVLIDVVDRVAEANLAVSGWFRSSAPVEILYERGGLDLLMNEPGSQVWIWRGTAQWSIWLRGRRVRVVNFECDEVRVKSTSIRIEEPFEPSGFRRKVLTSCTRALIGPLNEIQSQPQGSP